MVPPDSHRVSPAPCYSGSVSDHHLLASTGLSPSVGLLSSQFRLRRSSPCGDVLLPRRRPEGQQRFGLLPVAATWRITCCSLFLFLLRCFSSEGSPCLSCDRQYPPKGGWVAPFGYPRINASLQLPAAFRSLARPSSPLHTKASTVCPYLLLLAWLAQPLQSHKPGAQSARSFLSFYSFTTTMSKNTLYKNICIVFVSQSIEWMNER